MKGRKLAGAVFASALLFIAVPSAGAQLAVSVGSATTSITLVSTTADGALSKDVTFGFGNGVATTDPTRVSLTRPTAKMSFAPLKGVDASVESLLAIQAKAEMCAPGEVDCTYQDADTLLSIAMPSSVSQTAVGGIEVGAISAEVALDGLSAFTNLGEVDVDADLESGLTAADEAAFGILNSADKDKSSSSQGISVGHLSIFSVAQMLDQLAMPTESIADLAALGDAVGVPSATTDALRDAEDAYDEAESDEAAWQAAIAQLSDGDVTNDGAALAVIGGYATKYATSLTACVSSGSCASADPTDSAVVSSTMAIVKSALLASIDTARSAIDDELRDLPLLELEGLTIGVATEAFDTYATNSALFDWERAFVLNVAVPKPADINQHIDELETLMEDAINSIGGAIGVAMTGSVELAKTTLPTPVQDGPYWTASSALTLVAIDVTADLPVSPAGFSASGGSGFAAAATTQSAGTRVLSLNAYSEHRPPSATNNGNLDDPTNNGLGGPGSGSGSGGPGLANTGIQSILTIGGIAFIALALKLRRWLGDAA